MGDYRLTLFNGISSPREHDAFGGMIALFGRLEKRFTSNPGRSATLVSWASQVISILGNLAIIPLVLHRVGADAGIWFFLLSWIGLFSILDFGFSQCISRQITFSFGHKGFLKGRPKGRFLRVGGPRSIGSTVAASKVIFHSISGVILLGGIGAERTFLFSGHMVGDVHARICWYLVVVGSVLLNETRVYTTALTGMLLVPWLKLIQLTQGLMQSLLILLFLVLSPRLELLGLAILLSNLFAFWRVHRMWKLRAPAGLTMSRAKWSVIARLWHSSWEQGVASAAAYFIFSVNPLVIGYLLGKEAVAVYFLPFRIVMILFSSLTEIIGPQVNFMISSYRDHQIHALLVRFFRIFIVVSVPGFVGFLAFAVAGPWAIHLWSIGKVAPPPALFWIMSLYNFLALEQTLLACFITAHGVQPFARPAVAGAIMNVTFLFALIPWMGLVGAAFATFLSQLLSANWFVVWYASRLFAEHFKTTPFAEAWSAAVASLKRDLRLA